MFPQNALLFGPQSEDRRARLFVEDIGDQFDPDAVPGFEGMSEQEQFAFSVDGRALGALCEPGVSDRALAILWEDFVEARRAYDAIHFRCGRGARVPSEVRVRAGASAGLSHDGEGKLIAMRQSIDGELNVIPHSLGPGNDGDFGVPQFAVSGGRNQRLFVREAERLQAHVLTFEGDGLNVQV